MPLQVTVPPVGVWQAVVHSVRPQVASALLFAQAFPQLWWPAAQRKENVPLWQMGVPFGSEGQLVHWAPQAVASLSAGQALRQRWCPVAQVKSQAPAVQVVLAEPAGAGQAVHRVPQEFVLVSESHTPPQLCEPVGH